MAPAGSPLPSGALKGVHLAQSCRPGPRRPGVSVAPVPGLRCCAGFLQVQTSGAALRLRGAGFSLPGLLSSGNVGRGAGALEP